MLRNIIDFIWDKIFKKRIIELVKYVTLHEKLIFNSNGVLQVGLDSHLQNALINLSSDNVIIGNNVSFGHNVCCLTGTHEYCQNRSSKTI